MNDVKYIETALDNSGLFLAEYLTYFDDWAAKSIDPYIVQRTDVGSFQVQVNPKNKYRIWTKPDSGIVDWIVSQFHHSQSKTYNRNLSIIVDLDLYPTGCQSLAKDSLTWLIQRFCPSVMGIAFNLQLQYSTDDLKGCLERGHRVIVFTPMDAEGNFFCLDYYEPNTDLPLYVGLQRTNIDKRGECVPTSSFATLWTDDIAAPTDKPQPVNKSFQQRTNEIMAKQKKVKSDHLLDEFMQAVLHLGDGTTTEVSKDSSGFTHVTCGTLSYRFTRCNSTVHAITQIADMIADDGGGALKYPLAIYQDQCFGSRGKPQLLNQKRTVIKHLSDKLTARDINAFLSSSYEVIGNLANFSIKLALSAIPEIIFIEVYPPHSLEGDQPIIIVTVDLKSMGCLMAFMQMDEQNKQSAILPWEDEPQHQGSVSQNWASNNPKPEQKPGTLFLLEQNGDDDRQRINSVRERLANTFNTLEVDIYAELQLQEKLSDNHPPLMEQIRRILLQGKSVAVIWRSDAITGELSSLSNFATKVLEWVEMARTIKAPHYYIGNF